MTPYQRYARLRFTQLEMLCAVADAGGIRAAAEQLHLSPPAVSKALREIEAFLQFPLFERLPRGMVATPRGERLVAHARLLLNELHGMAADSDVAKPLRGGQITVGASPYVVARVLPALLACLPRDAGSGAPVAVKIRDGHLALLIEQLLLGQIEALVTLYAAGDLAGTDTDSLAIDKLRDEPLVVVAPPALLKVGRRKFGWDALAALPWVLPPPSTHLRRALDSMFHLEGLSPPAPRIEASHLEGNVRLSAAGLGLTIAPLDLVREHVDAGRLAVLQLRRPPPDSLMVLVYRRVSATYLVGVQDLKAAARAAFG